MWATLFSRRDLLAGVGDDEVAAGGVDREHLLPFDVTRAQDDLPAPHQFVEHVTGPRAAPHPQGQVGVGGVGEPVDVVEFADPVGGVADGEVEDAAAADGGELVPVADQQHPDLHFVSQAQQRARCLGRASRPR